MQNALITALIITLAIPIFGLFAQIINDIIINIISAFLGSKTAVLIVNYLTFPGVIHHELSHALLAFLTGAKVHEIALFKPDGNSLGHVSYSARGIFIFKAIQHTFSAAAPVLCGAVTSTALIYFLCHTEMPVWVFILTCWFAVSVIVHMRLSPADIKNMWKGIPVIFVLILIAVWVFNFNILEIGGIV